MTGDRAEEVRKYVAARYGHLPPSVQKKILQAHLASMDRKPDAFLKDRGVDVITKITSTNYKDFLFDDAPR